MSGPREPYRSRSLSKAAFAAVEACMFGTVFARTRGIRAGRNMRDLPDDLAPVKRRETRPRDRSLNGKARRCARQVAS